MPFHCVVVTPEQQLLDEQLSQAIVPASDGLIGILAGRSPLLAKLGVGPLRVDLQSGQRREYLIEGGVAQMKDNELTILTLHATPADEITADAAQSEYAEALSRETTTKAEVARKEADLQRARAKATMAKK